MNFFRSASVACLLFLVACGGPLKYQLRGTQLSPSSDAKVVAAIDKDHGKTDIEIDASNLTPADRLVEGGTTYVVWARKDDKAQWARLGALDVDSDGRHGSGKFTTPETAFDLAVSVEKDAAAVAPSGKTVFEQRIEK